MAGPTRPPMKREDILKTISVLALACIILSLVFDARWLLWAAGLLCLGNAFESRLTAAVARAWTGFSHALGAFNSRVIMTLTFYLVLTPIACICRLTNREMRAQFHENSRPSTFENVEKTYRPEDFEKIW